MNGMLADAALPPLDRERYGRVFDFPVRRYYERLGFANLASARSDCAEAPHAFETLATRFVSEYERRASSSRSG
jgi:hypothetical protein